MSETERRDDLYVAGLTHLVEALGGRLEVRAVFDDTEVVVMRQRNEDEAGWRHAFCMHRC